MIAMLVTIACIAFLLALFWLAENDAGWTGLASYVILQVIKWTAVVAVLLAVILIGVYAISIY